MSIIDYHLRPHSLISTDPKPELGICICIPCYNEIGIVAVIDCLFQCEVEGFHCEVIVLINESETEPLAVRAINETTYQNLLAYSSNNQKQSIELHPIYVRNIPPKRAGVGLARKLSMDEALDRLQAAGGTNQVIACYDADSICDPNYMQEVFTFFKANAQYDAVSIDYAHPLDQENSVQIMNYELHLRYFIEMQRLLDLPFAFHTVGSSMAVRAAAYRSEGGMNTKKAGEDFYFLQKFISKNKCGELHTTCIYPSSRVSVRVPFGTGRAIGIMLDNKEPMTTYNYRSFDELGSFLVLLRPLWIAGMNEVVGILESIDNQLVIIYLQGLSAGSKIKEIKKNTSSYASFIKRFYQWFDAFQLMKYLHYMRDHGYNSITMEVATHSLMERLRHPTDNTLLDRLMVLRDLQRTTDYGHLVQSRSKL